MNVSFHVVKRNQRLMIINRDNHVVYTPPDYLRSYIKSRDELKDVALELNNGSHYIDSIRKFEKIVWDRHLKKSYWICPIDFPDCTENCGNYGCGN